MVKNIMLDLKIKYYAKVSTEQQIEQAVLDTETEVTR